MQAFDLYVHHLIQNILAATLIVEHFSKTSSYVLMIE